MIATPDDIAAIVEMAKAETGRFPYLRPDAEKIYGLSRLCVTSKQHFACINDSGCLLAVADNHLWAEKKMAQAVLWTGDFDLVREYRDWLEDRPAIRIGCMDFSFDYDPRIGFGLQRIGFKKHGDMYIWRK